MVDRDVRGALFEVRHRIAPRLHDVLDEAIGVRNRSLRVVHEARLRGPPFPCESRLFLGRQRPERELLHPLLARFQLVFGLAPVADLPDSPARTRDQTGPRSRFVRALWTRAQATTASATIAIATTTINNVL